MVKAVSCCQCSPLPKLSWAQGYDIPPSQGELGTLFGEPSPVAALPRPLQGHSCRKCKQIPSLPSSLCILLFPMGKSNPIPLDPAVGIQAGTTFSLRHVPQDPVGMCSVDWMRSSSADSDAFVSCLCCLLQSREVSCLDVQVNDGRLRKDTMGEPFTDLRSKSGCHLVTEALSVLHLSMLVLKLLRIQDKISLIPVACGGDCS